MHSHHLYSKKEFLPVFLTGFEPVHTLMLRSRWDLDWDHPIPNDEMRTGMHNRLYVEQKFFTSPVTFVLGAQEIDRENVF